MANTGAIVRAAAAEAVHAVSQEGRSLDAAIAAVEARVPTDDRALLRALCYGCLRSHYRLQHWIGQLLGRPLKRKDRVIGALLAVGLYQLEDTRIPDHAAVSQTVEAARLLRRPKLAGLINACLRRFQREQIANSATDLEEVRWNHPQWFIDTLKRDWPDDWEAILTENDARAPMWLRANSARNSAVEYNEKLVLAGIRASTLEGVPDALRLAEPCSVESLPGFVDGAVSVQDAAAQIAARWLLANTRGAVLDACAAPGGKSGHLLEVGVDEITLTAVERDSSRIDSIHQNLDRLGCHATIIAADASKPKEWWNGEPFDGILLDAPCSASGVIRRHPDIKLLRRASDIEALSRLQGDLLEALWPLLAPGGRLLYATCSTLASENDAVVGRFLKRHDEAVEDDVLPNYNVRDLMRRKACGYQILPGTAGLDGFYYACLEKKVS
ncbi:MAG: 16S rRNA (cytosine(967)-C(5))-methyltransferase RsmB [Gammaproteobacteria bacterium]|nr:16S rRNA (cytosine(967)-C(5))-methyltransferase RsmB [Gammaproteobacteria bacterium]